MDKHIQPDIFLPFYTIGYFFLIEIHIFLSGYLPSAVSRTICFYIFCLRERSDCCRRKIPQSQYFFLQLLAAAALWHTDIILLSYFRKPFFHFIMITISFPGKKLLILTIGFFILIIFNFC